MHCPEIGILGTFQKLFTKVFYVLVISSSMLHDQAIEFLSGKGNPSLILTAGIFYRKKRPRVFSPFIAGLREVIKNLSNCLFSFLEKTTSWYLRREPLPLQELIQVDNHKLQSPT